MQGPGVPVRGKVAWLMHIQPHQLDQLLNLVGSDCQCRNISPGLRQLVADGKDCVFWGACTAILAAEKIRQQALGRMTCTTAMATQQRAACT